jgi:hypothetical protein
MILTFFLDNDPSDQQYEVVATDAIPVATLVTEEEDIEEPAALVATPPPTAPRQEQQPSSSSSAPDPSACLTSRHPMQMRECPNCHQGSRTRIETFPTCQSWLLAGILLVVFWPVFWIPLVVDTCKQTNHHCVSCGAKVGQVDAFYDCCVKRRG